MRTRALLVLIKFKVLAFFYRTIVTRLVTKIDQMHPRQRSSVRTPRPSVVIAQRGCRSKPANENHTARQLTCAEVPKHTSSGVKLDQRDISAKGMTKAGPRCPRSCSFSKSTSPPRRRAAEKKAGPDQKTETNPGAHMRCWMSSLSMARRTKL